MEKAHLVSFATDSAQRSPARAIIQAISDDIGGDIGMAGVMVQLRVMAHYDEALLLQFEHPKTVGAVLGAAGRTIRPLFPCSSQ